VLEVKGGKGAPVGEGKCKLTYSGIRATRPKDRGPSVDDSKRKYDSITVHLGVALLYIYNMRAAK
jgi:hypothetical protein